MRSRNYTVTITIILLTLIFSCKKEQKPPPYQFSQNDINTNYQTIEIDDKDSFDKEIEIEIDYTTYANSHLITLYSKCTKESEYFTTDKEEVELHKIKGIKDWLYLTDGYSNSEVSGFVYLYDISDKSFYGDDIEGDKPLADYWSNYRRNLMKKEYDLVKKYPNINRYGPLLEIKHNNKTLEFWYTFCYPFNEAKSESYLLQDYYPDSNEILIREQYYEGAYDLIYNLNFEDYKCSITSTPFFNKSRTNMISIDRIYGGDSELVIHEINNGFYKLLMKHNLKDGPDDSIEIVNVEWLNDKEAKIIFDKIDSMHIRINNKGEVIF